MGNITITFILILAHVFAALWLIECSRRKELRHKYWALRRTNTDTELKNLVLEMRVVYLESQLKGGAEGEEGVARSS